MANCDFQKGADETVVQQLNELFGNTFNLDIIKSVATACQFDVYASSNHLIELTHKYKPQSSSIMENITVSSATLNKKSKKGIDIENTIVNINRGYKVLILLRGLPGSGKSTLAKYLLEKTIGFNGNTAKTHILSTDDFFMKNGVYVHDPIKLSDAHGWNHQRAFRVMSKGHSPVIIDNTNTQMWEMKPYGMMATDFGYILEILEPDTHWCFNDKELAKRNKHDVPKTTIKNMIERYDKNVTPMKLLTAYDCKYKLQKLPQFRLYPPIKQNNFNNQINSTKENNANPNKTFETFEIIERFPAIENINLMDFNDSEDNISSSNSKTSFENQSSKASSVDNLLMHEEGSFLTSTNVLKPISTTKNADSTNFFNSNSAWGVDDVALRSWDIVTPINDSAASVDMTPPEIIVNVDDEIETLDQSTSTDDDDFYILRTLSNNLLTQGIKILNTCSRDINRNVPVQSQGIRKKLMLDKSCLTEDFFEDQNMHIDQLVCLFPNIPLKHIKYWYNKCNRDIEWTIELLLAEKEDVINVLVDDDASDHEDQLEEEEEESVPIVIDSDSSSSNDANESPKATKHKLKSPSMSSEESWQLKKCIESKVTISDSHYSKHLLKIKQTRYGDPSSGNSNNVQDEPQATTSSATEPESPEDNNWVNLEFDDVVLEESSPKQDQIDVVETVELNLGEYFVKQLEDNFGDPNFLYPKGFQPVVQVPVGLARQLYTFYIESVYQQMEAQKNVMETLVKEDEEFARKLQEKEEMSVQSEKISEPKEPTQFKEIISEQIQLSKWQKEVDQWKEMTPDTLAAKLTRKKLFTVFPSLDKDTLVEILHAHDNVYKDTVETLLASTSLNHVEGDMETIKEPPLNDAVIKEMREEQENCKCVEGENEPCSATSYREEANKYLKKRSDLYEKAQKYYQTGMKEVAQFYSGLASQQTRYYERANGFAATAFLDEHSKRLQDFNTLDLHFLYVKEAIPALDVFLDRNINLLRLSSSKNVEFLQIITGRGKNSENGISKIKPVVQARLKRRGIIYQHLNPGLLKIKVTINSKVTSEL